MPSAKVQRYQRVALQAQVRGAIASLRMLDLLMQVDDLAKEACEQWRILHEMEDAINFELEKPAKEVTHWNPPFTYSNVENLVGRVTFSRVGMQNVAKHAHAALTELGG